MKKSELRQIIKETIRQELNEQGVPIIGNLDNSPGGPGTSGCAGITLLTPTSCATTMYGGLEALQAQWEAMKQHPSKRIIDLAFVCTDDTPQMSIWFEWTMCRSQWISS